MITEEEIEKYLETRIKSVDKCLDNMIDKSIGAINVSGLTKKEKEQVINQRNCLLIQKHCYNEILSYMKGEEK